MYHKLDKNNKVVPCSREEGAKALAKNRIALDVDEGTGDSVSTVFLVFEHVGGTFFETMAFIGQEGEIQKRYRTYDEAVAGHAELCERLGKGRLE